MRITNSSIYNVAQSRLGALVEEFNEANREVTTGKKINRLSDDPVGISRVVDLRSGVANLEQLSKNISTARNWLTAGESSLATIGDLMDDVKVLALAMRNDSNTLDDRANAAAQVTEILDQVLDLTNVQVNGQYVFSGTKADTKPFSFDDPANPTMVSYSGNDGAFTVKTGKDSNMVVGYSGEDIFGSENLTVDDTNNKIDFMENMGAGFGIELTATIPPGSYNRNELATAIENAMTAASLVSGNSVAYDVTYNDTSEHFSIWDDGSTPLAGLRLLFGNGTNVNQSLAPDIGFDTVNAADTAPIESDQSVQWGLFKTLFDLKGYLESNNSFGIERSFASIDTQFENMTNAVSRIGYKGVALDAKTAMIDDLNLSYKTQKSDIEEVDIIEAITAVQAKETAYKAALASTAKVMQLSLMDYL
jgi:flagellar hook-associated protein 3